MKKCINCGAEMNDDDVFCMKCGTKNENKPQKLNIPTSGLKSVFGSSGLRKQTVRKYFLGYGMLPTILIIVGIVLCIFGILAIIGIPLILAGLYLRFRGNQAGEQAVDEAERELVELLKHNYQEKINMDESELNLIDPVYIIGFGDEPHASLALTENDLSKNSGVKALKGIFNQAKTLTNSDDPLVGYKIGTDGNVRSLLIQVTTYLFSEEQMFIYTANADISTGIIYDESTHEIFYKDISGITLEESLAKGMDPSKKQFRYYKTNRITLIGNNFRLNSSMRVNSSGPAFSSSFAAMRSLIREKKKG